MLGRSATRIELCKDNDWDELLEARKVMEQKRLDQVKKQQQVTKFQNHGFGGQFSNVSGISGGQSMMKSNQSIFQSQMVFNQMNSEANQEGISSIQGVSGL